ncbi:MAG TPA: sugar-binding protein [Armatimonadota bacterium]|nr:sugar-binding protein [Armatimonadota bacterium]
MSADGPSYEFPPVALFQTIALCRQLGRARRLDGRLSDWSDGYLLAPLGELVGGEQYARLLMGWDERGLYVAARVHKAEPVVVNRQNPPSGDAIELFVDTRASGTSHRATQFCYHFFALPGGGGADRREALIWQTPIRRALRRAPQVESRYLTVAAQQGEDGYGIEIALAAEGLPGFEPRVGARLSVGIIVHDIQRGHQYWGVSPDFPYAHDPSTWGLVELVAGPPAEV